MKTSDRFVFAACGLVVGLLIHPVGAQGIHLEDPIGLFAEANSFPQNVVLTGHCFTAEPNCDSACDSLCEASCDQGPCDAMACCGGQPKCNCCKCREFLLGDLAGIRSCFAEHGITARSSLTQFYQGVTSGGNRRTGRYGAKLDLYFDLNTEAMGWWKGGNILVHASDWNFGQNSNADAAPLSPVNVNLLYPKSEPSYSVSHLLLEQKLSESGFIAMVGRYNLLDLWEGFYPDFGRGVDGFMNVSMIVPFNLVEPSLAPISNVAGLVKAGEKGLQYGVLVTESKNHPTNIGLTYPNGVTFLIFGRKYTDFFGQYGTHTIGVNAATGDYTNLDLNQIGLPGGLPVPNKQTGTWSVAYLGEQRFGQHPCNKNRYHKLWYYVDWSDKSTNPFEYTAGFTLESFGAIASRPGDRMGIGYFYMGLNSDFQNLLNVIEPADDIHGGEVYYNAEITPWCHLTFDLQAIRPTFNSRDTAIVPAVRGRIDF